MQSIQGLYFDTVNTITADCDEELLQGAMKLCEIYHGKLSKTTENSDVYRINHSEGKEVSVEYSTLEIIQCAKKFYELTEGYFNIALEPLINVWNIKNRKEPPKDEEIKKALTCIDLQLLKYDSNKVTLPAGMKIDLGGIAKGYITDSIASYLRNNGVKHGLLNFGGNLVAISGKNEDTPWLVGLQRPFAPSQQEFFAVTELDDQTIVTSGIYERFFIWEGKIYHHIISPQTGYPADTGIISVSVKGKDSMVADAIATSVLLMGWEKGKFLAEKLGYMVLGILNTGEIVKSDDFEVRFVK